MMMMVGGNQGAQRKPTQTRRTCKHRNPLRIKPYVEKKPIYHKHPSETIQLTFSNVNKEEHGNSACRANWGWKLLKQMCKKLCCHTEVKWVIMLLLPGRSNQLLCGSPSCCRKWFWLKVERRWCIHRDVIVRLCISVHACICVSGQMCVCVKVCIGPCGYNWLMYLCAYTVPLTAPTYIYIMCVCVFSLAASSQAWTQCSRWEGCAFMKEFCNFQNCGLSFTLFNKLVWALIMENGCRGTEGAREREWERDFWQVSDSLPISQNMFLLFALWGLLSFLDYLDSKLETARGKKEESWKITRACNPLREWNPSLPLSPMNMAPSFNSTSTAVNDSVFNLKTCLLHYLQVDAAHGNYPWKQDLNIEFCFVLIREHKHECSLRGTFTVWTKSCVENIEDSG